MPMKKKLLPFFVAIGLILVVAAGYLVMRLVEIYTPSKDVVDVGKLFGVSGDEVALILNEGLQDTKGIYLEDQTYLPIGWVNDMLNERFYWDDVEKLLVYALPDRIVYADKNTLGGAGSPLIKVMEDGIYLSMGLVLNYTDIRIQAYDKGTVRRVFFDTIRNQEEHASVKREGKVRETNTIKSPIMTQLLQDEKVKVLETLENWSRIQTKDGYIGYVESMRLEEHYSETPSSAFEAPVYNSLSLGEKVSLVWHQVTTAEANKSMEELMSNTSGVNVISPTWFSLTDNDGNFTSLASHAYVEKAHGMGVQVWALLDNFSKDVQSEVLLAPTSNRKKLIDGLVKEAETFELDGINLDFEGIKEEAGVHYVQFIRELSIACREKGIILSVDNYVPAPYNEFYNRKEQGIVVDYVIIMGYDEHHAGGDAGSVASIEFVEKGITDSLMSVPKEKLINAVPFYTRVWTVEGDEVKSSALGIARAKAWVEENKVELYWQDELGQYYGEYDSDDGKKLIWMEEEKSLGLKMDLISKYGLAGVGCWKLGFEPSAIWDVIN